MTRRRTTASRAARRPGGTLVTLPGAAVAVRARERARLDADALRRTIDPTTLPPNYLPAGYRPPAFGLRIDDKTP